MILTHTSEAIRQLGKYEVSTEDCITTIERGCVTVASAIQVLLECILVGAHYVAT